MKKRKFNILLNIAVLCMCTVAIAIGVYSAKTASLNVSGTIGFTAHNCKVRVLGKITGAVDSSNTAITSNTDTATINYTDSSDTSKGKLIDGTSDSWDFKKIYFDDLNAKDDAIATDIVFTFTLTNESTAYDVIATLNVDKIPSNVKPTVTFTNASTNSGFECVLKDKTAVTMTLTLSLLTSENISDATNNLDLTLSFDKVNKNQTAEALGYTLDDSDKSTLTGVPEPTETNATLNIPSYFYDSTNGVQFVKSLGNNSELTNASAYSNISIPSSVTSIGSDAFSDCTNLATITIPSSVTSISVRAFSGCSSLTTITIPSSVTSIGNYVFRDCTSLSTIIIPSSVTSIGNSAFSGCTGLTTITIPSSVTSIKQYAFSDTKFLTNLQTNQKGIYECADGKKIVISVPTTITDTTIDLTDVVCIAYEAFSGCTSLTTITIPSSVTSISWKAFKGCTGFTSITIQGGVTSIDASAFEGCTSLASITIPSSVTSIGNYAFSRCTKLTTITIPSSVTSIGDSVFYNCSSLTTITIPSSVTSIGGSAFEGCTSLASITIPSSVTSISYRAFYGCTSLSTITIPSGVTSIGSSAFEGCTSLSTITIPSSVTSISDRAFLSCTGLTSITFEETNNWQYAYGPNYKDLTSDMSLTDPEVNATKFKDEWASYYFRQKGTN